MTYTDPLTHYDHTRGGASFYVATLGPRARARYESMVSQVDVARATVGALSDRRRACEARVASIVLSLRDALSDDKELRRRLEERRTAEQAVQFSTKAARSMMS